MPAFKRPLYGLNLPKFEEQIAHRYFAEHQPLSAQTIANGIILPLLKTELPALKAVYEGGVCDSQFNFIAGYKRNNTEKARNYECVRAYTPSAQTTILNSDEDVIWGGIAYSHFGHFITDTFARLWWVIRNQAFDKKIIFVKNRAFNHENFMPFFRMMGINPDNIVFLDKPTRFKSITIPDQSFYFFSNYHREFTVPYEAIRQSVQPAEHKKIYLSRTRLARQDCVNEEYFENFYRERGYTIVYPEQLSLAEQIALISGADEVVCTLGTLSHLALFAKSQTRFVILLRTREKLNVTQILINQANDIHAVFVDVTCNFLPSRYTAYCFYIGPNHTWKRFVAEEYGEQLDIDLTTYLNSAESRFGKYLQLWQQVFSEPKEFKKIQNDTAFDFLENLEIIFSHSDVSFETVAAKLAKQFNDSDGLKNKLADKTFVFSRIDGSHARTIRLNGNGALDTVAGEANRNEQFWRIQNNKLVFLDHRKGLTSTYFSVHPAKNGLEALGYFERNHAIVFKLSEVIEK
ncbi:glycosyltransferase family 61 protein [Neisseria perflava]|uniref:glycosyltransferase family 61 protein n=1 Tax=Neisseria perflava TaxID=33053 RepID=UPI00209F5A4B|nr:glycosyltransferase 61 family protein [Neisseria perflava]MCP1659291.1 hypothetical protein [Neisseria perflava]